MEGIVFVEVIICCAYGFYPLFLWCVCPLNRVVSSGNFFPPES